MEVKWSCLLCWVGQSHCLVKGGDRVGWSHIHYIHTPFSLSFSLCVFLSLFPSLSPSLSKGRYGGICLINLSDKSDSCLRVRVDERLSAGPSLYICQRRGRGKGWKETNWSRKAGHSPSAPPLFPPPLLPIQVLGGILKCLLAYSISFPL